MAKTTKSILSLDFTVILIAISILQALSPCILHLNDSLEGSVSPPTYPPKLPQEMKILRSLNTKKIWLDQIEDKLGYSNISLEAMMR